MSSGGENPLRNADENKNKSLTDTIKDARADSKLTKEELDTIVDRYEKEKKDILKSSETNQINELHQVNALLVESFDDMFEEYELKGADDLKRIENILKVVNPMRLATDKMGVIINSEITDFYKKNENRTVSKNIKLDSNGQLRFQKFYEGFFTRSGVAEVKDTSEALSLNDIKKLEKMLTAQNNMLRGSNPDFIGYMKDAVEKNPALSRLANISTSSVGDLHLGQLETINGIPRISDIDDALQGGSPIADITRMIASIRASTTDTTEASANVKAFLDTLQTGLRGNSLDNLTEVPKLKNKSETQEQLLRGGFVRAGNDGKMLEDLMKNGVTRITEAEKTNLSEIIGKPIIDGRHMVSDGIGSAGKDKILVTVQDGKDIKIYEFKEQDKTHAYATFWQNHPNSERAATAQGLGVDIKAVEIGGKPYTQKEIVPGYEGFDPVKSDANGRKWASEQIALQLSALYKKDGKSSEILAELQKTDVKKALDAVGSAYATRISSAFASARDAYPEVVATNEKNEATKALDKKVKEVQKALGDTSKNLADFQKLKTELEGLIKMATEKKVDTSNIDDANKQLAALHTKIKELTTPPAKAQEAIKVSNNERFKDQIKILEEFFKQNPDLNNFMDKLFANDSAYLALVKILGVPLRDDNKYHKDVRKAILDTQNELGIGKDGAFGPKTLEAWRASDKYGNKVG